MLWLTEQDVVERAPLDAAVDVLEATLPRVVHGAAHNISKPLGTWEPTSSAHALGAFSAQNGFAASKAWGC